MNEGEVIYKKQVMEDRELASANERTTAPTFLDAASSVLQHHVVLSC
jgi:hypothetical protein